MDNIGSAAAAVALASTGIFTGAALFISAVEHPAEMEHGVSSFYSYFPGMYKRAARLQGGLSFLGAHAALIAAAKAADHDAKLGWRLSGVLIGAVFPFTMLVMMPTNKTILKQAEADEEEKVALLQKWGRLHLVRTALSATSFATMIGILICNRKK